METLVLPDTQAAALTDAFEAPDGLRLHANVWQPEHPPRSVLVLVHGYGEHSGRYAHVGAFLVGHGHALYTFDHRGHGRSDGRRGVVDRFDRYLGDLDAFLAYVRAREREAPLFLLGHSMGGTVSTLYCLERRPALAGLILSSPFFRPGADFPAVPRRLSGLASTLLPLLPTVALDRNHLSRDPSVVRRAKTDPLNYLRRIPARQGHEMVVATDRIRARLHALTLPFLVFHGTADQIADPRGSTELYARAAAEDKTLGLYEGLYHETLNEPEKQQVLVDLAAWLDEHL